MYCKNIIFFICMSLSLFATQVELMKSSKIDSIVKKLSKTIKRRYPCDYRSSTVLFLAASKTDGLKIKTSDRKIETNDRQVIIRTKSDGILCQSLLLKNLYETQNENHKNDSFVSLQNGSNICTAHALNILSTIAQQYQELASEDIDKVQSIIEKSFNENASYSNVLKIIMLSDYLMIDLPFHNKLVAYIQNKKFKESDYVKMQQEDFVLPSAYTKILFKNNLVQENPITIQLPAEILSFSFNKSGNRLAVKTKEKKLYILSTSDGSLLKISTVPIESNYYDPIYYENNADVISHLPRKIIFNDNEENIITTSFNDNNRNELMIYIDKVFGNIHTRLNYKGNLFIEDKIVNSSKYTIINNCLRNSFDENIVYISEYLNGIHIYDIKSDKIIKTILSRNPLGLIALNKNTVIYGKGERDDNSPGDIDFYDIKKNKCVYSLKSDKNIHNSFFYNYEHVQYNDATKMIAVAREDNSIDIYHMGNFIEKDELKKLPARQQLLLKLYLDNNRYVYSKYQNEIDEILKKVSIIH